MSQKTTATLFNSHIFLALCKENVFPSYEQIPPKSFRSQKTTRTNPILYLANLIVQNWILLKPEKKPFVAFRRTRGVQSSKYKKIVGDPGLDKGSAEIDEPLRGHEPGPPTEALRRGDFEPQPEPGGHGCRISRSRCVWGKPIMAEKAYSATGKPRMSRQRQVWTTLQFAIWQ